MNQPCSVPSSEYRPQIAALVGDMLNVVYYDGTEQIVCPFAMKYIMDALEKVPTSVHPYVRDTLRVRVNIVLGRSLRILRLAFVVVIAGTVLLRGKCHATQTGRRQRSLAHVHVCKLQGVLNSLTCSCYTKVL